MTSLLKQVFPFEIFSNDFESLKANRKWCHGSTAAAMSNVMLDDPGSNRGVNHGCMYLSHRTIECIKY
jgi:hypothetical protein